DGIDAAADLAEIAADGAAAAAELENAGAGIDGQRPEQVGAPWAQVVLRWPVANSELQFPGGARQVARGAANLFEIALGVVAVAIGEVALGARRAGVDALGRGREAVEFDQAR